MIVWWVDVETNEWMQQHAEQEEGRRGASHPYLEGALGDGLPRGLQADDDALALCDWWDVVGWWGGSMSMIVRMSSQVHGGCLNRAPQTAPTCHARTLDGLLGELDDEVHLACDADVAEEAEVGACVHVLCRAVSCDGLCKCKVLSVPKT